MSTEIIAQDLQWCDGGEHYAVSPELNTHWRIDDSGAYCPECAEFSNCTWGHTGEHPGAEAFRANLFKLEIAEACEQCGVVIDCDADEPCKRYEASTHVVPTQEELDVHGMVLCPACTPAAARCMCGECEPRDSDD